MNNENLKGYGFHERTASEQREIARKGGVASGISRNFKGALKKKLKEHPELLDQMIDAICREAADGDVKAFLAIIDLNGESVQRELAKLKAREVKLKEKAAMAPEQEEVEDNGFIDALNGTAAEDWSDADE